MALNMDTAEDGINGTHETWDDVLREWEAGRYPVKPKDVNIDFVFETSVCYPGAPYEERYKEYPRLENSLFDPQPFAKHLSTTQYPYLTAFTNLSGDSVLVIPTNVPGTQFKSIKEFMEQATEEHQIFFWRYVAVLIKGMWNSGKTHFYVSTHGLGVGYFHLRIDPKPKYYITGVDRV